MPIICVASWSSTVSHVSVIFHERPINNCLFIISPDKKDATTYVVPKDGYFVFIVLFTERPSNVNKKYQVYLLEVSIHK